MVKTLTIRIQAEQAEVLEAVARADGVAVAEAIRSAISAHIEARRLDSDFQSRLRAVQDRNRTLIKRLTTT